MGGYGALRLGLGYPDTYGSVNSHSGAVMHGAKTYTKPEQAEFKRVFGARPAGSNHDLLVLAKKAKRAGKLPKLLIDCGTEDYLLADNREFHAKLDAMGVPHQYAEFPGSAQVGLLGHAHPGCPAVPREEPAAAGQGEVA